MIQVHRFRLYPSRGVEKKLFSSFDKCCSVYNYCLENKAFKDNVLPKLKQEHPELYEVHSIVLQNVVHQLQNNLHVLHVLKEKGHRAVSYTHLRAHETRHDLVCRLLLEKK